MSTVTETLKSTPTPETLPRRIEPGIAGTLRDPLVQPLGPDQLEVTYHWETPDDKHTYLHLLLRKSPDEPFAVVHTNFDSQDIKGQGDALWGFATAQIQGISNQGNFPVHDEVDVNDYSRRLPEADPRYQHLGGNKYLGIYMPQPPHRQPYHAERM